MDLGAFGASEVRALPGAAALLAEPPAKLAAPRITSRPT